jgi:hypothetical protein
MVKQLVINLGNGSECSGRRSQFMLPMNMTGLSSESSIILPITANTRALSATGPDWKKTWNSYLLDRVKTVLNSWQHHVEGNADGSNGSWNGLGKWCHGLRQREKYP